MLILLLCVWIQVVRRGSTASAPLLLGVVLSRAMGSDPDRNSNRETCSEHTC